MKLIKLTEIYVKDARMMYAPVWVVVGKINAIGYTTLYLGTDKILTPSVQYNYGVLFVKEEPEEIFKKIEEAEYEEYD